jgi:hypothetical protein
MKRLIRLVASIALVGALFTGAAVTLDLSDPEPAAADHYYAHSVCMWWGAYWFGSGQVTVIIAKYPVYAWGKAYVYCRFRVVNTSNKCHSMMYDPVGDEHIIFFNIPCNGPVP